MPFTKAQLEAKFNVLVYVRWDLVPIHLWTRGVLKERGVKIPRSAKPDAIKGGGVGHGNHYNFLFDERKWLPETEWTQPKLIETEQPRLKVNFER